MLASEGERLRLAYQKAFEESFIDNYEGWKDVLGSINSLIEMINEELQEDFKTYSYDDFCRLAKEVIDDRMQLVNWTKLVQEESRKKKKEDGSGTFSKNSKIRTKHHFHVMESDVLSMCFEMTMKNSLGEKTYRKYKKEIERKNNEVVL
jgi:hypothetical protein